MPSRNSLKILVGRFGSAPAYVNVPDGVASVSVADVLKGANIKLGSSERVWVNGERAARGKRVRKGDIVCVVSPKEASSR